MKRKLTFGLMLICAFALTNCSEQIVPPIIEDDQIVEEAPSTEIESEDAGIPFEVYATTAETKTAANGNGTDWSVRDSINVFHSYNGGFSNDGAFAIRDVAEGLFGGRLNQPLADGQSHNWYFIYPYSSSNTTPTSATVTIGASKDENGKYVQVQHEANSKEHLAGPNYPMWGKTTTAANETPKMNVEHLSSVVALKVCNDGAGEDVYIKTLSFSVPKYTEYEEDGKTVKKTHQSEAIVGKFTFNATTSISYAPVDKETSDITTISLTTPIYLPKDSDITIYLAIKPFVADNRYVKVSINGSERGANISANFQPGKVTTLKVSVKPPKYETESDALEITSKGRLSGDADINLITFGGMFTKKSIIINGREVEDVYVVGMKESMTGVEYGEGKITLDGFAKEVIAALPVGFHASRWNNKETAMTIDVVDVQLPKYKGITTIFGSYQKFSQLERRYWFSETYGSIMSAAGKGWNLSKGITREFLTETLGIDAKTITFNGMVANGDFDQENVIVLDDEPVYKFMSDQIDGNVQAYLSKFDYGNDEATLEGLKDILNAKFNGDQITFSEAAWETGRAIYNKIYNRVALSAGNTITSAAFNQIGITDEEAMMHYIRDMRFKIVITTHPFSSDSGYNPIVFWGFDANASN